VKNLAGVETCDGDIVAELYAAGINVVPQELTGGEVPTRVHGSLSGWEFRRAWYYWVATPIAPNLGLPLDVAMKLYETHNGDVRAGGDCACRSPEEWVQRYTTQGQRVVVDPDGSQEKQVQEFVKSGFISDPNYYYVKNEEETSLTVVVPCYHIDTQEGLETFARTINYASVRNLDSARR